jgi:hypothetical protein
MGDETQDCYPNQTCNAGLTCLSDLCVRLTEAGEREVPLSATGIVAGSGWYTTTDCKVDPLNCTAGGNEAPRDFDGTPFCTKGRTAVSDGNNFGASLVLRFRPEFDAAAAGIIGFAFDLTGTSPPEVEVSLQSPRPTPTTLAGGFAGKQPVGQRATVRFADLMLYIFNAPLDPSRIALIGFGLVPGDVPIVFDYCVANVSVIKR